MIYTNIEIKNASLYLDVMKSINNLHDKMGCPKEFGEDENRRTTTGNYIDEFWQAANIGDWRGDEAIVSDAFQKLCENFSD